MTAGMTARRDRFRLLSVPDHLRSLDDTVDDVERASKERDAAISAEVREVLDELKSVRRALYTAALGFVVGFPALAFVIAQLGG